MKIALNTETPNDKTENTSVPVFNYADEAIVQEDPPSKIFDLSKELTRLSKKKNVIAEIKLRTRYR